MGIERVTEEGWRASAVGPSDDQRTSARSRLVLRIAGLIGWEIDAATGSIIHDDGLAQLFGIPDEALDGSMAPFVERIHPDDRDKVVTSYEGATVAGGQYRTEFRIVSPDGATVRWLAGVGEGILRDDGLVSVVGYNCDISQRLHEQQVLDEALARNKWWRLEADHRIKNHLQMVAGMLEAQARAATSAETREALGVALSRIGNVATVHRVLAERGDDRDVDLSPFLKEAAEATIAATDFRNHVDLEVEVEPTQCPPDFAINVAHIVSELLTNAVKHAPDDSRLAIRIASSVTGRNFRLTVADDGVGLPDDFNMRKGGVGSKIMLALAKSLGGAVKPIDSEQGAAFALTCPAPVQPVAPGDPPGS